MRKITFISALFATVFMFLALGSTKAQAWGNCEDRIFPWNTSTAFYRCDKTEQEPDSEEFCTWFQQGGELSFQWYLEEGAEVLDCQCRKTWADFETHPYEFLCTAFVEETDEGDDVMGLTGKIFWKGGPIQAEGVEIELGNGQGGGFFLKCRPDPSCD
jgi:hypothetical protein